MSGAVGGGSGASNFMKNPVGNLVNGFLNDTQSASKVVSNWATGGLFAKQLGQDHKTLSQQGSNFLGFNNEGGSFGDGRGFESENTKVDPIPSVVAEDPAAAQQKGDAARRAAIAQEQVDAQQKRPGRGGTILTDNFQYKV